MPEMFVALIIGKDAYTSLMPLFLHAHTSFVFLMQNTGGIFKAHKGDHTDLVRRGKTEGQKR